MIKKSFKTFCENLLDLFIPMGIFYLFLLLGIFFFVLAVVGHLGDALGEFSRLINVSAEQSSASVSEFLSYSFGQIDWNAGLLRTVRQILDDDWISATLKGFFQTIGSSGEGFEEQFKQIVEKLSRSLSLDFGAFATTCAVGVLLANLAVRFALHAKRGNKNIKKFIVALVVLPIAETIILVVFFLLLSVIGWYALLVAAVLSALAGVLSLSASWYVHKSATFVLRSVLTAKNLGSYAAANLLIILTDVVLALLLVLINPLVAVLLMIPVLIYSFAIIGIITDEYVSDLAAAKKSAENHE